MWSAAAAADILIFAPSQPFSSSSLPTSHTPPNAQTNSSATRNPNPPPSPLRPDQNVKAIKYITKRRHRLLPRSPTHISFTTFGSSTPPHHQRRARSVPPHTAQATPVKETTTTQVRWARPPSGADDRAPRSTMTPCIPPRTLRSFYEPSDFSHCVPAPTRPTPCVPVSPRGDEQPTAHRRPLPNRNQPAKLHEPKNATRSETPPSTKTTPCQTYVIGPSRRKPTQVVAKYGQRQDRAPAQRSWRSGPADESAVGHRHVPPESAQEVR
ncbi:hypothetical protein Salat_0025300 [Sesamum alatum]|uniref:Uncharacterized protein n=1 Tax=Sesamum alatum TaxID=300844 RepID=A0AAE1YV59_9LAMI|nr:hypothetical protein Salat_0025300 [Sesamum alatum]